MDVKQALDRTRSGAIKQTSPSEYCSFRFDFTVFFLEEDGTVDSVRFKADRVLLSGYDEGDC